MTVLLRLLKVGLALPEDYEISFMTRKLSNHFKFSTRSFSLKLEYIYICTEVFCYLYHTFFVHVYITNRTSIKFRRILEYITRIHIHVHIHI